jgi:hypothetical protein
MIGLELLVLLAPAAAAASPPTTPPKYVMDADEGKVVCKLITEGDSRIPNRICRTELQWEQMSRENEQDMRSSRNQRSCGSDLYC